MKSSSPYDLLYDLYQLHLIDSALADIKRKAAALDPGRQQLLNLKSHQKEWESKKAIVDQLNKEAGELESKQAFITDRLKKIDKELYQTGVPPREAEALQKEIPHLKEQLEEVDTRILELWEQVAAAKEGLEKSHKRLLQAKKEFDNYQEVVKKKQTELESEFRKNLQLRPQYEQRVDPSLLRQYNSIKGRVDDTGMTLVHGDTCSACSTILPIKIVEALKEHKLITCPSCHRILFQLSQEK
jgi:predicted  nucleic acid-binding Zn-ribbon protein